MRLLPKILLGAALVAALPGWARAQWTLEAALEEAAAQSPDAAIASERLAAARAAREQAAAAWLPRVDARATYMQTNNPMQAFGAILNQGTFDNSINFNEPGQVDAFTAGLYLQQTLYSGGRIGAQKAAAEAALNAARQGEAATLSQLAMEVVRSFYGIRQADEAVRALEASLEGYDEALRVGIAREEAGTLLRTDRLNLEVQRSQVARQLLSARQQAQLSRRQLAFLMGHEPTEPVEIAPGDGAAMRLPEQFSPLQRPEIKAVESQARAAEKQADAARAGHMPTVGAFASVQADKGWRRDGDGGSWMAGVTVNIPVFDGFETRSQTRAALAESRAAREQTRKLKLALSLELEQARLDHELAVEQIALADKELALAQESADLSRDRFNAGTLLASELIDVETRLMQARVQRAVAAAQEQVALAALRRAAGLPIMPEASVR